MSGRDIDRARLGWWVLAAVFAAAIGYVVYSFLGTFVFGVFIYYGTRPVYRRLKGRTPHKNVAAVVSIFALALPALLLLAYTTAVGLAELDTFLEARDIDLGQFETLLNPYFNISEAISDPGSLLAEPTIRDALFTILNDLSSYLGFVGTAALHLFVMVTLAFYLLRDDHRIAAWFRQRFSDAGGVVEAYGRVVDRDFSNIFFGNILNAAFTGIIGAISYSVINFFAPPGVALPYPFLLGLLSGVASLVPVVGIKLVYIPAALYLGLQTGGDPALVWFPLVFVAVSFIVVDVIPDLVLRPYVSGRGLHLGMVMLAYIFGPLLFGWYGIFLGPMILVLFVHFVRLILPELLAGKPIEPEALGEDVWTGAADRQGTQEALDEFRDDATADEFTFDTDADAGAGSDADAGAGSDTEAGAGSGTGSGGAASDDSGGGGSVGSGSAPPEDS